MTEVNNETEDEKVKPVRVVQNEDILKYEPMVEKYMRDYVKKNWNEANLGKHQGMVSLGNSGWTIEDIRQQLRTEVCIALQKYNPDYITEGGLSVKESTFVFQHLFNRTGQLMKKLVKRKYGYGIWVSNIEDIQWETEKE